MLFLPQTEIGTHERTSTELHCIEDICWNGEAVFCGGSIHVTSHKESAPNILLLRGLATHLREDSVSPALRRIHSRLGSIRADWHAGSRPVKIEMDYAVLTELARGWRRCADGACMQMRSLHASHARRSASGRATVPATQPRQR